MPEENIISRDWNDITAFYLDKNYRTEGLKYNHGLDALGKLCSWISSSGYSKNLFAFTSHHRLNIFQSPPQYPQCLLIQHLNLTPTEDGRVQFVFIDTFKESRQWKRSANQNDICKRLESFMLQVGWINHLSK